MDTFQRFLRKDYRDSDVSQDLYIPKGTKVTILSCTLHHEYASGVKVIFMYKNKEYDGCASFFNVRYPDWLKEY